MENVKTEGEQETQEKVYSLDTGLEFLRSLLGKYVGKSTLYNAIYKDDLLGGEKDENGEWKFSEQSLLAYATRKHGYRPSAQDTPANVFVPARAISTEETRERQDEGDLSTAEACLFLGQLIHEEIGPSAIHNAVHRGGIVGSYKVLRNRFFPPQSLIQYAKEYRGYQEPTEVGVQAGEAPLQVEFADPEEIKLVQEEEGEDTSSMPDETSLEELQGPGDTDQEERHVRALLAKVDQEAAEIADLLDIPVQNGYDALATMTGQALLFEQEAPIEGEDTPAQALSNHALSAEPVTQIKAPTKEEPVILFPTCYRCGRQFERESDFRAEKFIVNGVLTYRDVCQDGRCDPKVIALAQAQVARLETEISELSACLNESRKLCLEIIHAIDRQLVFQPDKEL